MRSESPGHERREESPGRAEGQEFVFHSRRWFFLFCALMASMLLAGNALYGTVLATRRSRSYCLGCHQRVGPALMWEPSDRHSEGMACVACHGLLPDQPGRPGAISARPETINPNCMGCHPSVLDGRPLGKVIEVSIPTAAGIGQVEKAYRWELRYVMYEWHLKRKICVCTDCHRNISHERESRRFKHRPKMTYCKACHYHAAKDDYVKVTPLPMIEVKESGAKRNGMAGDHDGTS